MKMPWPTASAPHDKVSSDRLKYLKNSKGDIRDGLDKAKKGGKKPKKAAEAAPIKVVDKCYLFVAKEWPEFKKQCLTILKDFEFNADNEIQGDYIGAVRAAFDKKQAGIAMKFVSF